MPNIPPQLTDLQNAVLTLLHEAQDSAVAELDSSPGGTAAISTATQITTWLNEGAADMCRNALPAPGQVTASGQSAATYSYESLGATATLGQLWYARSVSFNGAVLKPISRTALSVWFPTFQSDPTATPLYWYRNGVAGIGIYPQPNVAGTLVASGFEIPKPLSASTDTLSAWIADHLTKGPIWYAAAQVALQNDEDMSLKQRAVTWSAAYESLYRELQMQLWQSDPSLARALWAIPPMQPPMGAQPAGQQG